MNTSLLERCLQTIETLWAIIDDIDTYGDMAKGNDKAYRLLVEKKQRERWSKTDIVTDGYIFTSGVIKDLEAAIAEQVNLTYTGHLDADSALIMLDRLDVGSDDDVRVDAISKVIRGLVQAKPQEPIGYLAFRNGAPAWDDDCVCQDAVYPIDGDDDRVSVAIYTRPQALEPQEPDLVQIASDIMGACMNGDLSDKWEYVADCLVANDFDGLTKLVALEPMSDDKMKSLFIQIKQRMGAELYAKDSVTQPIEAHHNIGVNK